MAVSVPIALGAEGTAAPSADELRREQASLGTRAQAALLELYGLESTLAETRAELAALDARRAKVRERQEATRRHARAAARAATVSQQRLDELLRTLYERAEPDPVAVLLGAQSLDEALAGLESLDRAAQANVRIVQKARAARRKLARLDARLSERSRRLAQLAASARGRTLALEAAAAERRDTLAELRRREDLNARQISSLEAQARAAQERSAAIQAAPARASDSEPQALSAAAPAPTPTPQAAEDPGAAVAPAAAGGRTMTVTALGYSLPGHTASGLPVGHGIVAVDPDVIPLGTRLHVPGYGDAVAADTGSAIQGAVIDLWFPTTAKALQWGRRTVVITIR